MESTLIAHLATKAPVTLRRGTPTHLALGPLLAVVPLATACGSQNGDHPVPQSAPGPQQPAEMIAFVGVTVIDGTGSPARDDVVLTIAGDRITSLTDRSGWEPPPGTRVMAADGLFAIPGLWDMHVHLRCTDEASLPLYPALGVTGVRDMGGDIEEIHRWRRAIRAGEQLGPRILTPGPMLESPANEAAAASRYTLEDRSRTRIAVGSPEEARAAVERVQGLGADFVKMRTFHDEATYLALARAAKDQGMVLVGHPPWSVDPLVAVRAGQKSFEHGFYPWPLSDDSQERREELFSTLIDHGVALVPTLIAWESRMFGMDEIAAIAEDAGGSIEPRRRYLQPKHVAKWREEIEAAEGWPTEHGGWRATLDRHAGEIGEFHRAGVAVLPGSDVCGLLLYPGFSLHDELALFVERAGLSPLEALQSATLRSTEFLGLDSDLGSLEVGKIADVVLLGSDPLADIRHVADIRGVVIRGRYLDAARLKEMREQVIRAAQGE